MDLSQPFAVFVIHPGIRHDECQPASSRFECQVADLPVFHDLGGSPNARGSIARRGRGERPDNEGRETPDPSQTAFENKHSDDTAQEKHRSGHREPGEEYRQVPWKWLTPLQSTEPAEKTCYANPPRFTILAGLPVLPGAPWELISPRSVDLGTFHPELVGSLLRQPWGKCFAEGS